MITCGDGGDSGGELKKRKDETFCNKTTRKLTSWTMNFPSNGVWYL